MMEHPLKERLEDMNDTGVRKNYGGRMIFGDEKLTSLRSVPRCALGFASGRLTGRYAVRGSARPSLKSVTSFRISDTRQPIDEIPNPTFKGNFIHSNLNKVKWQ